MPLTPAELDELEFERGRLLARLAELDAIFAAERAAPTSSANPRPTSASPPASDAPTGDACWVLLSSAGLIGRLDASDDLPQAGPRQTHDVIVSAIRTSGEYGVITSLGRLIRANPADLPSVAVSEGSPNLQGTRRAVDVFELAAPERVVALTRLEPRMFGWALGTREGVVKRVNPEIPRKDEWTIVRLEDGDEVVGACELTGDQQALVFVTSDAQLLRYPASAVRPQGVAGGGMVGVKLAPGQHVLFFGVADLADAVVATNAGRLSRYQADPGSVKITPLDQFPEKGRATAGVRCHRFLKGEDVLQLAWVGRPPVIAATVTGSPSNLPAAEARRDGSGVAVASSLAAFGSRRPG